MLPQRLMLVRVLFPAWRFFERVEETPRLEYRVRTPTHGLSAWLILPPAPPRRPWNLLLNAEGNLWLACNALVQQLADELEDAEADALPMASTWTSYKLVQGVVLHAIAQTGSTTDAISYEFKLQGVAISDGTNGWLSAIHPIEHRQP